MANTVQLKRSAVGGSIPTTGQLGLGELAINTYDGKLYLKKSVSGTESVIEIGAGGGSGTVTSVAALIIGMTGTNISSSVANSTTTPVITLNIPTASETNRGALSAADWTIFNNKQPAGTYATGTGTVSGTNTGDNAANTTYASDYRAANFIAGTDYQAPLISGTSIKTLNGTSLLGSGDITITSGGGGGATVTDDTTTNVNYYPGMSSGTSGTWSTGYVSSTKFYFNPSTGTLNSTIFNSLSDISQKKNIIPIENACESINKLNGVEFEWVDNSKKSSGVIAQELEKVLPHLVSDSNGIKSVNYSGIIGYLIEANKELQKRIEVLENK